MNEQWRRTDADAHEAKAEALKFAEETVDGVMEVLAPIEQPIIRNAVAVMQRARERHETAAKLGKVA